MYCLLFRFGYTDDLSLDPASLVPPVEVGPGVPSELTHAGLDFLHQVSSRKEK